MNADAPDDESLIRAFMAIEIGPETRDTLARIIQRLKTNRFPVRWVPAENLHITLHFLGDVTKETLNLLSRDMAAIVQEENPFSCVLKGLGFFGTPRAPRVIWAGIEEPEGRLERIYLRVRDAIANYGIAVETRPFHPHITLGRTKPGGRNHDLAGSIRELSEKAMGTITVRNVTLMQSQLTPQGAIYTPHAIAGLGRGA